MDFRALGIWALMEEGNGLIALEVTTLPDFMNNFKLLQRFH